MSLIPKNGKVAVVGAGVSGLSFSYFLLKLRPDIRISIFESASRAGGWIYTQKFRDNGEPLLLEKGPRTLRGVSDGTLLIVDMLRNLNREDQIEVMKSSSVGNRKWLLDPSNNLVQTPNSIPLLAKFLMNDVTQGLVPGVLKEPFQKSSTDTQDESISSFILRRFGSLAIADNVLSAVMHGIYSGNVAQLSVQATLPSLVQMEKENGSIVKSVLKKILLKKKDAEANQLGPLLQQYEQHIAPQAGLAQLSQNLKKFPILRLHDGLQVLPNTLAESLQAQENIEIHYNTPVDRLQLLSGTVQANGKSERFDHIRYTLGAAALLKIVTDGEPRLYEVLDLFQYSTIFLANVYTKKGGVIPKGGNGFGFLVPSRNRNPESLLGVIYDSDTELDAQKLFGGAQVAKVPYDKVTFMLGGHYYSTRGIPLSNASIRAIKKVLSSVMGVDLDKYNIIIRDEALELSRDINLKEDDLLISYNLHKNCIPQYNVGFLDRAHEMADLVAKESHNKVSIGGTSLGKLGVPDCVINSLEAALEHR